MKFLILSLILCATIFASDAQVNVDPNTGIAGVVSFSHSDHFLNILQIRVKKLSDTDGLPEDLQERVNDILSNAEDGFTACNANAKAVMPWLQIRCISLQFKISISELKAIEDEANARASAAAAAITTNAAPAAVVQ